MLFNTFIYFIFIITLLPVFYFLPGRKSKNTFLLIASYIFYGYWDWRFCGFLALLTVVNFFAGKYLGSAPETRSASNKKAVFYSGIIFNLGILIFFKYFNFFIDSFSFFFNIFGSGSDLLHLNLIIPLGISFYTFQNISYITDVYRKKATHSESIIDFGLYVSFFPKLIAGPIERPGTFLTQLNKKLIPTKSQTIEGVTLIVTGLFKKVMIGDTAGRYADSIFGNIGYYASSEIIAALFLFTIQIYADFSGYTNIARGTAKLFGIELSENFDQPYFSKNITEFWKRWHITLSNWLRDYLYLPVSYSISRKLPREKYFNVKTEYLIYIYSTMITFTLCGLWHGASWNYVIWGGFHGIFLIIHRVVILNRKSIIHKYIVRFYGFSGINFKNLSSILLTFTSVVFAWIFFALKSWPSTVTFFNKLLKWESSGHTLLFISIIFSYSSALFIFDFLEFKTGRHDFILSLKSKGVALAVLAGLLVVTFIYMFIADPLPFVYFQF